MNEIEARVVQKLTIYDTGLTVDDLRNELSLTDDEIESALTRLEQTGVVHWTHSLCWRLTSAYRKELAG